MKKKWLLPVFAAFMIFSTTPHDNAEAATASQVIGAANKYLGIKYLYGGTTTSGLDCSGFTSKVFADLGIKLNRTSAAQYTQGTAISKANLQVGDLLFFNTSGKGVSHVAIYIGNGKMIHSQSNLGVSVSNLNDPYYWGSRYIGAKRVATLDAPVVQTSYNTVSEPAVNFSVYASRGAVAAKLAAALGLDTSNTTTGFTDVQSSDPNAGAIAAMKRAGIFVGDGTGKFNPNSPIKRADVALVLVKAYGLHHTGTYKTFSDVGNHYAANAISILASHGITVGKPNGTFGVSENVSLVDLAAFIQRAQSK